MQISCHCFYFNISSIHNKRQQGVALSARLQKGFPALIAINIANPACGPAAELDDRALGMNKYRFWTVSESVSSPVRVSGFHALPALQVDQLLELDDRARDMNKYRAIDKWATHLRALHQTVLNKLQ